MQDHRADYAPATSEWKHIDALDMRSPQKQADVNKMVRDEWPLVVDVIDVRPISP